MDTSLVQCTCTCTCTLKFFCSTSVCGSRAVREALGAAWTTAGRSMWWPGCQRDHRAGPGGCSGWRGGCRRWRTAGREGGREGMHGGVYTEYTHVHMSMYIHVYIHVYTCMYTRMTQNRKTNNYIPNQMKIGWWFCQSVEIKQMLVLQYHTRMNL